MKSKVGGQPLTKPLTKIQESLNTAISISWTYKFAPKENRKLQAEKHDKMHVVEFPKLLAIGLLSRRHSPQNYRQWGQVAANPSRDLQKVALPPAIVGLRLAVSWLSIPLRNPPLEKVWFQINEKIHHTLKTVKQLNISRWGAFFTGTDCCTEWNYLWWQNWRDKSIKFLSERK